MKIEQLYTNCLAHGAYYIESNGEAAVIDPLREVDQYILMAEERGAKIKYIFETHFHADFVSGHIDLARKTGAPIIYGPTQMKTGFEMTSAYDGQIFPLGNVKIKLIHTPGHTLESSCYLLIDEDGKEKAIFTGDTLFIGDVGRPDLAQKVIAELTQEKLAAMLYDSLHTKILPLPDDLIVYPGHGAGSACGKKMSKETTDTLGQQKQHNYALRKDLSKEEFIRELLTGLTPPPGYFPQNVLLNIGGYESIDIVLERSMTMLSVADFEKAMSDKNVIVLDTRDPETFAKGFVPGSINIGIDGSFAVWVGTIIPDVKRKLLLISEPGRENEVATRLARVGYDKAIGFLDGGFSSWKSSGKATDHIVSVDAMDVAAHHDRPIVDVRKASEYNAEHLMHAVNAPLDYLEQSATKVPSSGPVYVHCAAGYRSMIFVSCMKRKGFHNLINVRGGFKALKDSGKFLITDYREQLTEL